MPYDPDAEPIEDQTAHLEQALIDDFIRMRGCNPARLGTLSAAERQELLKEAIRYADAKLAEVEARAHYVHEIHGTR